jgi:hypothetical protein
MRPRRRRFARGAAAFRLSEPWVSVPCALATTSIESPASAASFPPAPASASTSALGSAPVATFTSNGCGIPPASAASMCSSLASTRSFCAEPTSAASTMPSGCCGASATSSASARTSTCTGCSARRPSTKRQSPSFSASARLVARSAASFPPCGGAASSVATGSSRPVTARRSG